MTDYVAIDGFVGPVSEPGFIGAFECYLLDGGEYPDSLYVDFNAGHCRPKIKSFCANGTMIRKFTYTHNQDNVRQTTYTSNWFGLIITTIYPNTGYFSYLPSYHVMMEVHYSTRKLHPITQMLLNAPAGRIPPVVAGGNVSPSLRSLNVRAVNRLRPL